MLTSTTNCPVLLRIAFCSIAHSSGASRLGLLHRAAQPAWGGVGVVEGAGAGAAWLCAGPLALGASLGVCWATEVPAAAIAATAIIIASFANFTDRSPESA